MDLLFLALFLTAIGAVLFAVDASGKVAGKPLQSIGLAFFAGGVAVWIFDILADLGKFD